jgi:hypothetical protein
MKLKEMSLLDKFLMYLGILLLSPYYNFKQFVLDVDKNFWHVAESQLTRDWHAIRTEKFAFTRLKEISKSTGISMTAVLLAGFGGGIRRYLQAVRDDKRMPEVMRALAPLPWKGHPLDGLVNHWTLGFMVLPVGISCPRRRLREAEKSIKELKTSPVLFTNFGTVPLLLGPPSCVSDVWATNWMTTMVLSNFPGPNFPLRSFNKHYCEDVTFWLPQMRGNSSLGVAFLSYNGGVRMTATIDKKIIPTSSNAELFAKCINQEVAELQRLFGSDADVV